MSYAEDQIVFPRRPNGRQTAESTARFQLQLQILRDWMVRYYRRLGCAVSSRGWCYALETCGAIEDKNQFKMAGQAISDWRKSGDLPLFLVAEDGAREMKGFDWHDEVEPKAYLIDHLRRALDQAETYSPCSFWEHQSYYPIVMVEKSDLVGLFRQVLPGAVKIFNARGNADVNSRVKLLEECQWAIEHDLEPIILYAGDHDPSGLLISDELKSWGVLGEIAALLEMEKELEDLRIIRFGLNQKQVEEGGFIKIPNLVTSSGKDLADPNHKDHFKPYVQNYLRTYGSWKVEANALVANPEYGRHIMKEALYEWIDIDGVNQWEADNHEAMLNTKEAANRARQWLLTLERTGFLFGETPQLKPADAMKLIQKQLPPEKDDECGPVIDI